MSLYLTSVMFYMLLYVEMNLLDMLVAAYLLKVMYYDLSVITLVLFDANLV